MNRREREKLNRASESVEERRERSRLDRHNKLDRARRAAETAEQKNARLEKRRERDRAGCLPLIAIDDTIATHTTHTASSAR